MPFKAIAKNIDKALDLVTITIMAMLVLDVTWQIISRYILKTPSAWTEELAGFLMIWAGMLGAAVAHRRKAHLGIDFFVEKFSRRNRDIIRLIVNFLTLFFTIGILTVGGIKLVVNTIATNQISPAMGVNMGYVYLAVPVSGIFMSVYSIRNAYYCYSDLFNNG